MPNPADAASVFFDHRSICPGASSNYKGTPLMDETWDKSTTADQWGECDQCISTHCQQVGTKWVFFVVLKVFFAFLRNHIFQRHHLSRKKVDRQKRGADVLVLTVISLIQVFAYVLHHNKKPVIALIFNPVSFQ